MSSLYLAPHNDDECLWGSFTILRHKPHVVVCLQSQVQQDRGYGITAAERETETDRALWWLGNPTWEQWRFSDANPDWEALEARLWILKKPVAPAAVYAPAVEEGGHEQHNTLGTIAQGVFGKLYRPYLTYVRGYLRSRGREVPFEPHWPALKLRAMACYTTQIKERSTMAWFIDDTLREYVPH